MITTQEQTIINEAFLILEREILSGKTISSPSDATDYIKIQLAGLDHEVFAVLFLSTQNQVISFEILSRGTIDQASVYPREIAKTALECNAKSVIIAHNHPSDNPLASGADKELTSTLIRALGLFDIAVLDHLIITRGPVFSFREHGLLAE